MDILGDISRVILALAGILACFIVINHLWQYWEDQRDLRNYSKRIDRRSGAYKLGGDKWN